MSLRLTCSQEEFGEKILENVVSIFDEYDSAWKKSAYLIDYFDTIDAYADDDYLETMFGSSDKAWELRSELEEVLRENQEIKFEDMGYDLSIYSSLQKLKIALFGKLFTLDSFWDTKEKRLRWICKQYQIYFERTVLMAYISKDKANSFVFTKSGIKSICKKNGENVECNAKYDDLIGNITYSDGAIYVNGKYVFVAPLKYDEADYFAKIFIQAVENAIDDCCV